MTNRELEAKLKAANKKISEQYNKLDAIEDEIECNSKCINEVLGKYLMIHNELYNDVLPRRKVQTVLQWLEKLLKLSE